MNPRSLPDNCFVQRIRVGGQEISADNVEITASAQLEIISSNTAGAVTGSVTDDDGKLFPISSVSLIPSDPRSRPVRQSVGDDDNFRITRIPPAK